MYTYIYKFYYYFTIYVITLSSSNLSRGLTLQPPTSRQGRCRTCRTTAAAFHALSRKCHLSSGLSVVVLAAGRKCFPLQQTPPVNNNINYQCTCCQLFWGTIVSLSRVISSWKVIEIHSQSDINISLVLVSYLISRTRRCRSRGPWSQVLKPWVYWKSPVDFDFLIQPNIWWLHKM